MIGNFLVSARDAIVGFLVTTVLGGILAVATWAHKLDHRVRVLEQSREDEQKSRERLEEKVDKLLFHLIPRDSGQS